MINAKYINNTYINAFQKQLLWFVIGYFLILVIQKINIKKLFKIIPFLYIFNIILLILVLIIGKEVNGAKCWLYIFNISFQPSELMKIVLTFYLVDIYNKSKLNTIKNEFIFLIKIFILTFLPSILVFLEPDTGAIINYLLILFIVFISSRLNKSFYIIISTIFITILSIFFYLYYYNIDLLTDLVGTSLFYRMDRLINFASGSSYQLENALITIGSSKLFRFDLSSILLYIPEAPTDFMFAFNIGNYGIISGIIVLVSYLIIELYILYKNKKIKRRNNHLIISTFNLLFIFQIIYNIGMNVGLLPIMGIPLPFLSYGGTSTLINFIIIGIILNIFNKDKTNMA